MRSANIPKNEVIDRLASVFRRLGYEGATLSELSNETGLQRASLYHYFPGGKEDMARAVLKQINASLKESILDPLETKEDPYERLNQMSHAVEKFYDGGQLNCFIALFILSASHKCFHEDIRNILQSWMTGLKNLAIETGIDPDIAQQRAENWLGALQGALIMSRGLGSCEPFRRVINDLPQTLLNKNFTENSI